MVAAALAALGMAYRIWATANHYPRFDSDEATMGLGALHIATGDNFPIFMYGQNYMGSIESYLAAPFLAVFGVTVGALRIPEILIFGAFITLMYLLTVRLYGSRWFASLVVALLALGSDRVIKDELIAHGGSAEIKLFAAALFLIALTAPKLAPPGRLLAYAGFGVLAGLALWSHWLIIPYLFAASLLLGWAGRGAATLRHLAAAASGLLVGAAPLIAYNLGAAPGQDSLSVFLRLSGGEPVPLLDRATGAIFLGVPLASGACEPGACGAVQRSWALLYLGLMVASALAAVRALRRSVGRKRLRPAAAALLLLAAAASIAAYARSSAAGQTPIESARYLSCLLVSTPALLWPLWSGLRGAPKARMAAVAGLAMTVAVMINATVGAVVHAVPDARNAARDERALLSALAAQHVAAVYSEYWTCNRISYLSSERTICAVLDDQLRPGFDRWLPYRRRVAEDPRPAYVFVAGSAADRAFTAHLARLDILSERTVVGGYHLYRPPQAVPLPL
ncbi:MAG TPA: hypothetical protein VFX61_06860 [Micromonosporaceae bacterium]|nr:hypothetical protein [Micromonosporaceae bacterium]